MRGVNKVILVGRLGGDPEIKQFQDGNKLATLSVATSEQWTDKNTGEKREATEWHRVVFNGRLAEVAGQYLRKGSQVYIEGKLKTRKWQDQSGQERFTTEIVANTLQMLGDGTNNRNQPQNPQGYNQPQGGNGYNQPQNPQGGNGYNQPQNPTKYFKT